MNIDYDQETGAASCQFPDVWISIYPAGMRHEPRTGKEVHYRGALLLRHGEEHIHLNAFDITDLDAFLACPEVKEVRAKMTEQHVQMNFLRTIIALKGGKEDD